MEEEEESRDNGKEEEKWEDKTKHPSAQHLQFYFLRKSISVPNIDFFLVTRPERDVQDV
jgi:hypothetical protein